VSFLYPLFLTAGAVLAIPILIHLFNLRKYKTVLFPHTRFLKNIQLRSQKQAQIRYKWLLLSRLLFLIALILAFAQPFFNKQQKHDVNKLQLIYIDNSYSMSVKKGARTMLDIARENALRQVKNARPGTRFLLLTNDVPVSYHAEPADKVFNAISSLDFSPAVKTTSQVLAMAQSMMQADNMPAADLYYYSDFQQSSFPGVPAASLTRNISFYGLPVQSAGAADVYIDTAYLSVPVLQAGKTNKLIVHTIAGGEAPANDLVLQLTVNGQVKSAATLNLQDKKESVDTLAFQVNDASWQHLQVTVNDGSVRFDDTFRIAARSSSSLSILVLNEGQPNPYLQAAFRAYSGFRFNQVDATTPPADFNNYNLLILNGITRISEQLGKTLNDALQRGQSICIFPGRTTNTDALNEGLKQLGDIRINALDTTVQTATTLQQGSAIVRDLFERIPDNVQLPVANWHYSISAGLNANQQSVLSFRNGDPMLACYTPSRGQLYLCATSADLQAGNFPGSYFFAPFLYQMAMQSGSSNVYALSAGAQQPVYLPLSGAGERAIMHLYAPGLDVIPPQRPNGAGVDVFIGQVVQQAGFYKLGQPDGDFTPVAVNQDKHESELNYRSISDLKNEWKGENISWPDMTIAGDLKTTAGNDFPIWKLCILLALVALTIETALLVKQPQVAV
jgi:hypothetical protein